MSEKKPEDLRISSVPPFGLRMLPDLREKISFAAEQNGRSLNAEIVARLEDSFEASPGDGASNPRLEKALVSIFAVLKQISETVEDNARDNLGYEAKLDELIERIDEALEKPSD